MEPDPKRVKTDERETFSFWFRNMPQEVWQNLSRYLTPTELQNFVVANVPPPLQTGPYPPPVPGPQYIGLPDDLDNFPMIVSRFKALEEPPYVKVKIVDNNISITVNDVIGTCVHGTLIYWAGADEFTFVLECYKKPEKAAKLLEDVARVFSFLALQKPISLRCQIAVYTANFVLPDLPVVNNVTLQWDKYITSQVGVIPYKSVNITVSTIYVPTARKIAVYIDDTSETFSTSELTFLCGVLSAFKFGMYPSYSWFLPAISNEPEVKFNDNTNNLYNMLQSLQIEQNFQDGVYGMFN